MAKHEDPILVELKKRCGEAQLGDQRVCPECGKEYRVGFDEEAGHGRWNFCCGACCRMYVDRLKEELELKK